MALSSQQLVELHTALKDRREQLRDELLSRLEESDDARLRDMVGWVRDAGDESLANTLAEFNLTQMERLSDQIETVENALARIDSGEYGECIDCGQEIAFERLRAMPATLLCIDCQSAREGQRFETPEPTL
jgi:RNA polymerase-binding protein DksA